MSVEKDKEITQDQANVHIALTNVRMKVLVTRSVLIGFFLLLILFILLISGVIKSTWQDKTIIGAVEGVLTYTMYPLVKHYLPAIRSAAAAEKRAKKKTS